MPGEALLVIRNDVDPAVEGEFNTWYHEEHIPNMLRSVPGFLTGYRYRAVEARQKYLALYELGDMGVVESPTYWAARPSSATATPRSQRMYGQFRDSTRGVYERLLTLPDPEPTDLSAARCVLVVGLEIDPLVEEEFRDWYNTEHLPLLAATPGVVRARRFALHREASRLQGDLTNYLAVYDVTLPEVLQTDGWRKGVSTPWTERMRRFFKRRVFEIYERIYPA